MRSYHRLTEGERNQVYALKKSGLTQCAIADQICVNKSTISRELKRNEPPLVCRRLITSCYATISNVLNCA